MGGAKNDEGVLVRLLRLATKRALTFDIGDRSVSVHLMSDSGKVY